LRVHDLSSGGPRLYGDYEDAIRRHSDFLTSNRIFLAFRVHDDPSTGRYISETFLHSPNAVGGYPLTIHKHSWIEVRAPSHTAG
jgi:hypothetical protein